MATASERITVLVTPAEKRRIAKLAKKAGVSRGEFMRRAALSYCPPVEEVVLSQMLDLLNNSTSKASAAIDDALAFVAASNRRVAEMEGGVSGQPDRR
jgi:uncharacterized protein (DUF1778 family)